jgi:acyl-CoA-dependent ceramide synthase
MLKYLELSVAPDVTFVTFMISWVLTRHVGYIWVLKSVWFDLPRFNKGYLSPAHFYTFRALLACLQVIMVIWFMAIIKVAVSVVRGKPAEDTRSDDEE